MWDRWFIVSTANILGSLLSFLLYRHLLSTLAHRLASTDSRFHALALVLKHDGLKLLVMIRLCPLPYSLSNGALSTFSTISPSSFALATALASPKLLIHVFIGSRLATLAQSEEKMDGVTKAVNWASIILGGALGLGVGWVVYRKTAARARELEAEERSKLVRQNSSSGTSSAGGGTRGLEHPDDFIDDLEDGWDDEEEEDGNGNDDIDFLDGSGGGGGRQGAGEGYRDEPTAAQNRETRFGEDEEGAIGLGSRQMARPQR